MFQYRSSAFGPSVSAIQGHLQAVEKELERIGRLAGRRTSVAASAAGDQIGETISALLSDMVDRFRIGSKAAGDSAMRFGNEAARAGARLSGDALQRVTAEVETRPLLMLGVAIGIGILIGAAASRR
jgi:ElaB/YqjD/DUF883 family membrane-anchored ribosome-binding protein